MSEGIYEIINNEGAICYVDTVTKGKTTFGKVWAAICESKLNGTVLEAYIDRFQYRTNNGKPEDSNPSGVIIKIENEVEAFLPISNARVYLNTDNDYSGKRIAVMVETFDPKSLSIIVNEIGVASSDFEIDMVNKALELIGRADTDGKYIRGTISKNVIDYSTKKTEGYTVDIHGVAAYLPIEETFFPRAVNVVGHNIIAGVKDICVDKMSILLSMKDPYEKIVQDLVPPEVMTATTGLVFMVTHDEVCVLLPGQKIGMIPTRLYQNRNYADWLNLTGSLISCIPFRDKDLNNRTSYFDFQYLVALQNEE